MLYNIPKITAYMGVLEILSKYLESTDHDTKGHCSWKILMIIGKQE